MRARAQQEFHLDPGHPNYPRWQRGIDNAVRRGELVASLLGGQLELRGSRILDIGTGIGGTTRTLTGHGATVIPVDVDSRRLRSVRATLPGISANRVDASFLSFRDAAFDAVILQDVIEHTSDPMRVLREIRRVLRHRGILYLSTPNRFSPLNLLSDPHWGLPLVALFRRRTIRFILHTFLRRDADRRDFAQLLSYRELERVLTRTGFELHLRQSTVARHMFREPGAVVWSEFHRRILRWTRRLKLHRLLVSSVNDEAGLLNRILVPTWYCLCRAR